MIENAGGAGSRESAARERLPGIRDKIYDLLDVVDESPENIHELTDVVEGPDFLQKEAVHEVGVADGRDNERKLHPVEKIHDLVDIVEEPFSEEQPGDLLDDEMRKKIMETVERIAREMIPGIAERVIREEIEKLKQETEEEVQ